MSKLEKLAMHLIWLEAFIVLEAKIKFKLDIRYGFLRLNSACQAYFDTFLCPPSFSGHFFWGDPKKKFLLLFLSAVRHPDTHTKKKLLLSDLRRPTCSQSNCCNRLRNEKVVSSISALKVSWKDVLLWKTNIKEKKKKCPFIILLGRTADGGQTEVFTSH